MYGSPPLPPSKDLNLPHQPTGGYGGGRAGEAESDLLRRCHQQQQQMSSSLLRYRSAPSTLLGEVCEDFVPGRASGLETDTILARFLAPDLRDEPPGGVAATVGHSSPSFPPPPQSTSAQDSSEPQQNRVYSSAPQMVFCPQQQMPSHSSAESPFRASIGSSSMETEQIKNGDFGSSCGLIRHSSSPAGLFSHLNVENGYGMLRGMGGFRNGSGFMVDAASRSKGQQINFSSRQNSIMSQISETESEDVDVSSPKDGSGGGSRAYIPGFPVASWEDSPPFGSSFSGGLKRSREEKMVAGLGSLDPQDGEMKNHAPGFPHQFSLPKTSPELATMEKLLHFHDAVPCKIRAKRGCATHPRSIAERVRRTRISERMKKLQELVPPKCKRNGSQGGIMDQIVLPRT